MFLSNECHIPHNIYLNCNTQIVKMNLYKFFIIFSPLFTHTYSKNAVIAQQLQHPTKQQQQVNQFIIYDPQTGRQLEPEQQPSVNPIELPQQWTPCSCSESVCMCCLGIRFGTSFNHRMCVAVEYNTAPIALQVRINHNSRQIFFTSFSATNLLPICVPILVPLPIQACLRLYDVRTYAGNVQVCISLVINILINPLFEYYFDCIRFGVHGIQFVKPLQELPGAAAGGGEGVNLSTALNENGTTNYVIHGGEGDGGSAAIEMIQGAEIKDQRELSRHVGKEGKLKGGKVEII